MTAAFTQFVFLLDDCYFELRMSHADLPGSRAPNDAATHHYDIKTFRGKVVARSGRRGDILQRAACAQKRCDGKHCTSCQTCGQAHVRLRIPSGPQTISK